MARTYRGRDIAGNIFGTTVYVVLTEASGVVRKRTFLDVRRAYAYRNEAIASGAFDRVSEVGQEPR